MTIKLYDLFTTQEQLIMLRDKHYKNFNVALQIAEKIKEFEVKVDFYTKEERRIAEQYAEKDEKGNLIIQNGTQIHFKNEEDAKNFNEEISKLRNTEIEIGEKIKLNIDEDLNKDEINFSPKDIMALMKFIDFVSANK